MGSTDRLALSTKESRPNAMCLTSSSISAAARPDYTVTKNFPHFSIPQSKTGRFKIASMQRIKSKFHNRLWNCPYQFTLKSSKVIFTSKSSRAFTGHRRCHCTPSCRLRATTNAATTLSGHSVCHQNAERSKAELRNQTRGDDDCISFWGIPSMPV